MTAFRVDKEIFKVEITFKVNVKENETLIKVEVSFKVKKLASKIKKLASKVKLAEFTVRLFITINLKFKVKLANIISNIHKNTICCQMLS